MSEHVLDSEKAVLPVLVAARAVDTPDAPFLTQVDGPSLTYAETQEAALLWANAFARLGVEEGDRVICMRRPGVDALTSWLGLGWLGAIDTSINTDYRSQMLAYVVANCGPRVLVIAHEFVDRLIDVASSIDPATVVVVPDSDAPTVDLPLRVMGRAEFFDGVSPGPTSFTPQPWTTSCIVYTSGTTGPSKGVILPWAQLYSTATGIFPPEDMSAADAFYSPFAMYHVSGKMPPVVAALSGGRLVVREFLSMTSYWPDIREHRITATVGGGPLMDMLLTQPPSSDDADLPLRLLILGPDCYNALEFSKRFDVRVGVAFNMTEISCPITSGWDFIDPRSCGRLRPGFPGYEVRLVDEHDQDVPPGAVGELIVRTAVPWTLNGGYFGYPDKTAEAWRNGWFHTGDGLRLDEEGNYFFVDRFKDAIRRKGENISSFEVELEVGQHPAVAECAVIPVPGGDAGDEVKACVVLVESAELAPAELIEFLIPRMPRFMVPRYIEVLDELPKSEALAKVRKVELRANPLNSATWDRVAAGIEIPRS